MTSYTDIPRSAVLRGATAALTLVATLAASAAADAAVRFGTWSPSEPYAGSVAGVDRLEAATGRRVEIVHWFQNWTADPNSSSVSPRAISTVTDSGRIPMISWEPQTASGGRDQPAYSLASIASGAHDAYIAAYARGMRDVGSVVYLRPMHEMNGNWYPWGTTVSGNTPEQFIAAWRRIHDIFTAQGAANVRWVWTPNNFDLAGLPAMEAFYPGAAYVDVLGADGYNWGTARPEFGGWRSFESIFRSAYNRLAALGPQPIWFAEVASSPNGGNKPAWVREMFARTLTMPRLDAIVWFNEFKELDWRADADPAVALAFNPDPAAAASLLATLRRRGGSAARVRTRGSSIGIGKASTTGSKYLRLTTSRRARRATMRWRATAAGRSRVRRVRTWTVTLDGRRVMRMRAHTKRRQSATRVLSRSGTHRWKVQGRDARGRTVVTATKTFRLARLPRKARPRR